MLLNYLEVISLLILMTQETDMNIVPKLSLNKHPKDNDNLSLVTARNIKLSNDESCLTNEESIRENTFIKNYLNGYYNTINEESDYYKIVAIIPCNIELVIICVTKDKPNEAEIFRYREKTSTTEETMVCSYGDGANKFAYHNGKIKGTFTYNVEGSLIVAIAEYDGDTEFIPLRTLNLGNLDDTTVYNDKDVLDQLLSVSPEVRIPKMNNVGYVTGNGYKGWYYFFIRFKINSVDYTQWFSFGHPIYLDKLDKQNIIKYCYSQVRHNMSDNGAFGIIMPSGSPDDGYCAGCSDYFSNTSDISNQSFTFEIQFSNDYYTKYQIGIICTNKTYTKAFRTADIVKTSNLMKYTLDNNSLLEAAAEEFIVDNYNYFNVKNIINYQNRLYISNYKETNANNDDIIKSGIIDQINYSISSKSVALYNDLVNDFTIVGSGISHYINFDSQYENDNSYSLELSKFFNMSSDTEVLVSGLSKQGLVFDLRTKLGYLKIIPSSATLTLNEISTPYGTTYYMSIGAYTLPAYINIAYASTWGSSSEPITYYQFTGLINITFLNGTTESPTTKIKLQDHAYNGTVLYTNPNISFNERIANPGFIPGEVYNFFIHFVDKYGHCTNGYRIPNNTRFTIDGEIQEVYPIKFMYGDTYYYGAVPINQDAVTYGGTLQTGNMRFFKSISAYSRDCYLYNEVADADKDALRTRVIELYRSFENEKYVGYKWYQLCTNCGMGVPLPYINNNGDRLFYLPYVKNDTLYNSMWNVMFSNIKIPKEYEGFFISYEKFEPISRLTGLLTRNDFRSQDFIKDVVLYTANCYKSDKMFFYSGQLDISDSLKFDYNLIRINAVNCFKIEDIQPYDYNQRCSSYMFCHDMNKPYNGNGIYPVPDTFAPTEYKLVVADSASDNRMGLGTAIQFRDAYALFPDYNPSASENTKIRLYHVTLLNTTRDIYMSNNKTLIRCSNIVYASGADRDLYKYTMPYDDVYGNGFITYDGCLIYENAGYSFNDSDLIIRRIEQNNKYYPTEFDRQHTYSQNCPFVAYVQFPVYDTFMYESKCFNNEPQGTVFYVKQDTANLDKANENNKFALGCLVSPPNSIDLFQNKMAGSDSFNTKTFSNYREDLVSVDNFNKTVRRSNVIQDESRENAWRTFPTEAYKNITENKGNITNLVGIGTMLLVHTEHSLFMFDTSNTLTTKDQTVQLSQQDAFEVNYKEVFTSILGYGGLQDDKAFVVDQFGYIYYNNDFNRFYRFDNGQLDTIDDDIIQWLDMYRPNNVRFANDKFNNRILIKFNYIVNGETKDAVISYNYLTNAFISLHDYYFDEAFNTKANLYLKCNVSHGDCTMHQFVRDGSSYGSFDNVKLTVGNPKTYQSKLGVIVNANYEVVKYLEYITYKLSKCANPVGIDYTTLPVEGHVVPYAGNELVVYNNQVNTGPLNITVDEESKKNIFAAFDKPYWDLGVWNFSYLRNKLSDYPNNINAGLMSRLFGNYFVVEFTFSNEDNLKVEFEELNYVLSKDKQV